MIRQGRINRRSGRAIGPIGTIARAVGGLVLIAVPVALSGIEWWHVGSALIALPLAAWALRALIAAAYRRFSPESLGRGNAISSGPGYALIAAVIGVGIALTYVTPADGAVAIWVFLGASMLVAAARGYAGCEVLAIPNALSGRDDQIGCILYTPIDAIEEARRSSRPSLSAGAQR